MKITVSVSPNGKITLIVCCDCEDEKHLEPKCHRPYSLQSRGQETEMSRDPGRYLEVGRVGKHLGSAGRRGSSPEVMQTGRPLAKKGLFL